MQCQRDVSGRTACSATTAIASADINGGPAPGLSARARRRRRWRRSSTKTLPHGMSFEWTELTYQQIAAGNTTLLVFPLCVLFVFLVLAAQYESLSLPLAIILIVPMCLLCGDRRRLADRRRQQHLHADRVHRAGRPGVQERDPDRGVRAAPGGRAGHDRVQAVLEAARLRLRPILMTSFAFIMGVVPLVMSRGAGAEMRHAMGVAVFSGMLGVTFFGLLLTPVFYVLIRRIGKRSVGAVVVAATLAGCAVGPNYKQPETPVAPTFGSAEPALYSAEQAQAGFWKQFDDATLDQLVDDSLNANHDLRIALGRFAEARAARHQSLYDLGPTVTARGGHQTSRLPEVQSGFPVTASYYDVGFDATWELDLFGRVRRGVEASNAQLQGAEANLRDAQVSVVAEVARTYFELRGQQDQLAVAKRNVENEQETFRLTDARLKAGRGTELDTSRAHAQLSTTLSTIDPLEAAVSRSIHRLGVLTGRDPNALTDLLSPPKELPGLPKTLAVGDPGAMLRRRPDIRVAERQLAASNAEIGVAVGDYFPKVTFTGSFGYDAASLNGLGTGASRAYSIGPGISWAAFDLGRVHAQVAGARARTNTALAQYEQTVLKALEETENALVTHARTRDQLVHASDAAESSAAGGQIGPGTLRGWRRGLPGSP